MSLPTSSLLGHGSSSPGASSSNSSNVSAAGSVGAWEALRKRSRLLETQLCKKLQEFSHIQTAIMNEGRKNTRISNARVVRADLELDSLRAASSASSSSAAAAASASSAALSTPLLQYESCVNELTELLRSFSETNDGLSRLLEESPPLATESNSYIVSKNRTLHHEHTIEFKRTQQNIHAALARAELLAGGDARRDADQSLRPRTEQLLREGNSLHQSLRMTDDVLASAVSARDSLRYQGAVFAGVGAKLTKLSAKFPVVGQLMNKIGLKHQRDMIVLACVVATCLIFTFLYVMAKP